MNSETEAAAAALHRCQKLCDEGIKLQKEGKPLLAAEKYLEGTIAARHMCFEVRFCCFEQYIKIMHWHHEMGRMLTPPEGQRKTVESIAKDKHEMIVFRTKAYYHLGFIACTINQFDLSAKYAQVIIDLVEESRESRQTLPNGASIERDIIIYLLGDDGVTQVPTKLGDCIDGMGTEAKMALSFLQSAAQSHDDSIVDRLGAGGGNCDCCGKTAEAVKNGELMQCSRCQMAFYCSGICQKRSWKAGHRLACRAPGQIEVGDMMLVNGIVRKPELNKKIVQIIKPAETKGRWEVVVHGSNNVISLASKNLSHIRPAK